MGFSKEVVDDALVACGRCCCICHKFCGVKIETHHIVPVSKEGDDSFENCIPLCFNCHADVEHYNAEHPKGRKFSPSELKKHRDNWFEKAGNSRYVSGSSSNERSIIQTISGDGNLIAGRDIQVRTSKVINKTIVQTDPGGKHITNETARKIQDLVKEYIDIWIDVGEDGKRAGQRIWSSLKREFNVTTYKEIPFNESERAVEWLRVQLVLARPKLRRRAPEKWRQSLYRAIYSKASELGIAKESLYGYAMEKLGLEDKLSTLTDLNQRDLQKLYDIMMRTVKCDRS